MGGRFVLLAWAQRHHLIKRKVIQYNGRYYHVANVAGPEELDDDLLTMLTEAYFSSPE